MEHLVDVAAPSGEGEDPAQQQEQVTDQAAQQAYEQQVRGVCYASLAPEITRMQRHLAVIGGTLCTTECTCFRRTLCANMCVGALTLMSCSWVSAVYLPAAPKAQDRRDTDLFLLRTQLVEHANMQQLHMSHQQYELAQQQAQQDQQQHYEAHVGHKREAEDADCERPRSLPRANCCANPTNQVIYVLLFAG